MIETSRRFVITGLVSLIAAPAIIHAAGLMPVRMVYDLELPDLERIELDANHLLHRNHEAKCPECVYLRRLHLRQAARKLQCLT